MLLISSAGLTIAYDPPSLEAGPIDSPANGSTVVATQGWNAAGESLADRPARLVSIGPAGDTNWIHDGPTEPRNWFYDVDPLPNGNFLVLNPVRNETVVYEYDPSSGDRVWTETFDRPDIHDVDLINGDELLVAGISVTRRTRDSVYIYNRTQERVTWEWFFEDHYPNQTDSGVSSRDWTHVNDVDKIGDGRFLVSPRDFDQVIVVNRSTKEIEMQLGEDGDHDILYEQHNPQYLESDNGTPTILVADSENSRIVEYERSGPGEWDRVWTLRGDLNWPRDADRLPNGNTLVVDSMNHRVIEVTPTGEVVWEVTVPWATYDAERTAHGDEPGGPTIRDQNASGVYRISGGSDPGVPGVPPMIVLLTEFGLGTVNSNMALELAKRVYHVAPWFTPTWLPTWSAILLALGLLALVWHGVSTKIWRRYVDRNRTN